MRYLGLDLGTKTLGVSLSDRSALISSSYKTITFSEGNFESTLDELKQIVDEFDIKTCVLGLPKNMDNSLGFAAERSLNFKKLLEDKLNLVVVLQDERMSSVEANNILIKGDISRKKRKKVVDSLSANIILQRFLDSKGR